jgi:hypothetical protein
MFTYIGQSVDWVDQGDIMVRHTLLSNLHAVLDAIMTCKSNKVKYSSRLRGPLGRQAMEYLEAKLWTLAARMV